MNTPSPSEKSWNEVLKSTRAKGAVAFCISALLLIIFYLPFFYQNVIFPKPGILLNDVILDLFTPVDWSVPVFSIIYLAILQTILSNARKPIVVVIGLTSYFSISILRMISMYMLTLEPPTDIILLVDPVTSHFYPEGGFAKDLFFSGHVSTMTLLILLEKNRWIRYLKIAGTLVVAFFLIWQHVHYTLDIVVAPIVTSLVYFSVSSFLKPAKMP